MPLAEDIVTSRYRLSAYSGDSVTVNETVHRDHLVLSGSNLHSPWQVGGLDLIDADSLQPVFDMNPEVVLLGTGMQQRFPASRVYALFGEQRIGLEVMDNGALCRTFNILVAEDRAVVAAILIDAAESG
ncbi:MAG: MTH938/NDUFAF3 family protein [Gammaproteobacteria bacterium]|nr:MTH938/NDUFAF3 family protein [Gammaproteobacteria bacterium]